ncbi:MAG: efflux RND transporter periplasmic adaptor subunit, partial [Opitutus sp.]
PMFKKFLIAFAGFIVVVIALGIVKAAQIKEISSVVHTPPASAVTTADAISADWHSSVKAIGTLAPVQGVTVSADAEGTIVNIAVESGSAVKRGDLLVEIDSSVERAQLAAAEARAALSTLSRDRAKDLWDRKASSQSEFDSADATLKQSSAEVEGLKAQIAKKQVRAPFDGRVGIRSVNLGQFVSRGQALLPLQKLDPIFVNFYVPQRQMQALSAKQKISVVVDAYETTPFEGTITAINSVVDAATRNVFVQATLGNPEETLRAGMFARVEVELPSTEPVVAVPATAIAYASYGNSVFIVEQIKDKDGKEYLGVRQQFVKLGATRGDLIAIAEGLKPGEKVVTAGVFKLRNGAHVQVNNTAQPTSNPEPTPANT